MGTKIPATIISQVHSQLLGDPQLPRSNPTTAFWQLPPHPTLSTVQSDTLPSTTDYAIIGSGVTGCSIAKNLLDHPASSNTSVTVFEARSLTSGATGRNGGALTSFVPSDYNLLSQHLGHDQAVKIARLANRTLEKMHALGSASAELQEASEVRKLRDVVSFQDMESFHRAQASFKLYEEHVPEDRSTTEVLTAEEALAKKYNIRNVAGAIVFNCGAFWPYRLITKIWEELFNQYSSRLSIETDTPVMGISYDAAMDSAHPFILTTPRGVVRAGKVIHATNGYTGHLLPRLRGKIFSVRGTMSTQKAGADFGQHGNERAWSFSHSGKFDAETVEFETGLYYMNQNPKTGDIFLGGEKVRMDELFVSDDTQVSAVSRENISTLLPKFFSKGWRENEMPKVRQVWSGIMGFTADHLPLVGKLPLSVTERGAEGGEWICAGFNGYGMPQCWSCGEAVAKMLVGEDVADFLPEVYLATADRLNDPQRMSPEAAMGRLMGL